MENKYKIKNLPHTSTNYKYIVCRFKDDNVWYWGCYNNLKRANDAAKSINGIIFSTNPQKTFDFS